MITDAIFKSHKVLIGATIADANLISSSVAEPDTTRVFPGGGTEVAWVFGTNYAKNSRVIEVSTHRVYRDDVGGVSNVSPSADPTRWTDEGPTMKWACHDTQVITRTVDTSPFTETVDPGAITHIGICGMQDVATVRVRMWTPAGGALVHDVTYGNEDVMGADPHWALYFQAPVYAAQKIISGLPVYPDCRVEVTLTGYGAKVGVGLISYGTVLEVGVAEYGAEVQIRDYGYTTTDKWGNTIRTPGAKGFDLAVSGKLPVEQANAVRQMLSRLVDVGAIHIPSERPEYAWLTTWGLLKPATMTAQDSALVSISFEVEGFI